MTAFCIGWDISMSGASVACPPGFPFWDGVIKAALKRTTTAVKAGCYNDSPDL